ncbi:hypothetical protein EVAR_507_1 [Eumeta japonica]|uniref:Uncharacterized protein n=1 Tax=Eumeta variegata TaxID=151549 RepID=A0A4C1SDE5_EUMVA|nr:hypothetical protein EVAR_507_1 [Eumeta japonica]
MDSKVCHRNSVEKQNPASTAVAGPDGLGWGVGKPPRPPVHQSEPNAPCLEEHVKSSVLDVVTASVTASSAASNPLSAGVQNLRDKPVCLDSNRDPTLGLDSGPAAGGGAGPGSQFCSLSLIRFRQRSRFQFI